MKPYGILRYLLDIADVDITTDLPKILNVGKDYPSRRITGNRDWTMSELYKIMDAIKQPYWLIPIVFSENEKKGIPTKGLFEKVAEMQTNFKNLEKK